MEFLEVKKLDKIYGKDKNLVNALSDISFTVKKGEFIAIVGSSGSGKSTLLHILGGVDKPTNGEIYLDNVDVVKMNENELAIFRRREVGIIYQFYNLIPILNVEENILLPSLLDKQKVNKEYLNKLVEKLNLKDKLNFLPSELSGGQQQRTAIGRSLINKPKLILADEPTGNLDSKMSLEIMELLKWCNKELGQTVIMVTHNNELAKMADRIIKIEDGKIIK